MLQYCKISSARLHLVHQLLKQSSVPFASLRYVYKGPQSMQMCRFPRVQRKEAAQHRTAQHSTSQPVAISKKHGTHLAVMRLTDERLTLASSFSSSLTTTSAKLANSRQLSASNLRFCLSMMHLHGHPSPPWTCKYFQLWMFFAFNATAFQNLFCNEKFLDTASHTYCSLLKHGVKGGWFIVAQLKVNNH